jgi:DNA mismatch repair protein MutL
MRSLAASAFRTPVILNHLTSAQVEQLQRIGLDIEPFGEQLWAVRNAQHS